MNDRDSNTRNFRVSSQISTRAQRERTRKKRQAVITVIIAFLAVCLIVAISFICREMINGDGGEHTNAPIQPVSTASADTQSSHDSTDSDTSSTSVPPEVTTAEQPPETTVPVSANYKTELKTQADIHRGDLILVDAKNKFVFPDSTSDLVNLWETRSEKWGTTASGKKKHSFSCATNILLSARTALNLNKMIDDFYDATQNQDVYFPENSGYRTEEIQNEISASKPGAELSAGFSEHNTGLAVCFRAWIQTSDGKDIFPYITSSDPSCVQINNWINQNCYKYGFIRRYPANKVSETKSAHYDYHYRYVGYPHAYAMMRSDLCLEEYLSSIAIRYPFNEAHYIFTADDGVKYEIYYVAADKAVGAVTSVPVPTDSPYTVSGNNYDGFIVTVTRG